MLRMVLASHSVLDRSRMIEFVATIAATVVVGLLGWATIVDLVDRHDHGPDSGRA